MKILFAGSPDSAAQILKNLAAQECEIVGVISQPDKRSKRGSKKEPSAVSAEATKLGIPLHNPESIDDAFKQIIYPVNYDFLVVSAYGKILPDWLLEHPEVAPINIHFSLLPKYRGASPIQSCLLNGDIKTGISIMKMTSGLDEGPVYSFHDHEILYLSNKINLENQLTRLCNKILFKSLLDILNSSQKPVEQDHHSATYCNKITKSSGMVNFLEEEAEHIFRKFKALNGWPGLFFKRNNIDIKIHGMAVQNPQIQEDMSDNFTFYKNGMTVKTVDSSIVITHLQFPGKKIITAADAANSYADFFAN